MKDFLILVLLVALFGWGIIFWPILIFAGLVLILFIAYKAKDLEINFKDVFVNIGNVIFLILKLPFIFIKSLVETMLNLKWYQAILLIFVLGQITFLILF